MGECGCCLCCWLGWVVVALGLGGYTKLYMRFDLGFVCGVYLWCAGGVSRRGPEEGIWMWWG